MQTRTKVDPAVLRRLLAVCLLGGSALALAQAPAPAPVSVPAVTPVLASPPDSPADQLRLAEGLLGRQFYDLARQELQRFLDAYPNDPAAAKAMLLLIESLRAEGKTDDIVAAVDRFRERWPTHEKIPALLLLKSDTLMRKQDWPGAQVSLQLVLASADTAAQEAATYYLGQIHVRRGEADKAGPLFARLAALPIGEGTPYRAHAKLATAALAQQKGDAAAAVAAYRDLAQVKTVPAVVREEALYRLAELAFFKGEFREANSGYEQLLAEFPGGVWTREARRRRAWSCFYLQEYARAAELAAEWKQANQDDARGELSYLYGAALVGACRYADALPVFRGMLARPDLPDEYRRLSRYQVAGCLLALEKFADVLPEAVAFLKDYPKAPEKADVGYFAAEATLRAGDTAQTIQYLQQALDAAPGGWAFLDSAAARLTDTLKKANRAKEAAAVYRMLAGREGVANPARMLLAAASLEEAQGDAVAATADLQRVRERFAAATGEYREATLALARLHADQGRFADAAALVQDLIKREQGQDQSRLQLFSGYLAYLQQKLPEAETQFRQVVVAAGSDAAVVAEANYYLAATLLEMKREPEALTVFAAVLKLPDTVRPHVPEPFLERLLRLFFVNGKLEECEAVSCSLLTAANPALALRARLMLARTLFARNRKAEARVALEQLVTQLDADKAAPAVALRREVLSILGELFLAEGQNDRAVNAFQGCLAGAVGGGEYAVRARCGLAQIFLQEGHANQALQQATAAFVLGNDPVYSPRAMVLAMQILVQQGKSTEALTTWKELATRFPAVAEARKSEPVVAALLARPPATLPAVGKP